MIINKNTFHIKEFKNKDKEKITDEWLEVKEEKLLKNKLIDNFKYIKGLIIDDGIVVDVEINSLKKEKNIKRNEIINQIYVIKQKLFDTDYQALKYAEGQLSEEEYALIKEQRQAWRDEINELEASLEVSDG